MDLCIYFWPSPDPSGGSLLHPFKCHSPSLTCTHTHTSEYKNINSKVNVINTLYLLMQTYYLCNNAHAMWSRQFTIFLWNKSTVKIHANKQMYVHKPTQAVQQQNKSGFCVCSLFWLREPSWEMGRRSSRPLGSRPLLHSGWSHLQGESLHQCWNSLCLRRCSREEADRIQYESLMW